MDHSSILHGIWYIFYCYGICNRYDINIFMNVHIYIYTHLGISSIIAFKGCYNISRFWSGSQTHCIPRMGLRSLPQLVWWWLIFSLMWAISSKASNGWLKSQHTGSVYPCVHWHGAQRLVIWIHVPVSEWEAHCGWFGKVGAWPKTPQYYVTMIYLKIDGLNGYNTVL